MTRQTATIIAIGIAAAGAGGYLYYAHKNSLWPFKPKCPPGTVWDPNTRQCITSGGTITGGGTTTGGIPNPPSQPPTVGKVSYISPDKAQVPISWSPVQEATYYKVYVNGQVVADNIQSTSYTLTLTPGQTYQIAIAACN